MRVQFFLPNGTNISFQELNRKYYQGIQLPGSNIYRSELETGAITLQEIENSFAGVGHRMFELFSKLNFYINEKPGLRLEALLTGEMQVTRNERKVKLKAGQYHLTDVPLFTALFKTNTSCSIFITYFSTELLQQLGVEVLPSTPLKMPDRMNYLIQEMLRNPYQENLREFYYQNSVRELLFFHLSQDQNLIYGELENRDIASIYQADAIIASNLQEHLSIDKLSRMTGTNEFKLKKGFKNVFGMGVFRRLIFRRMEQAKILLETTDKSIGDIATLAGYDTAAGFIHAFRREFEKTPREWRMDFRSEHGEE